MAKKKQHNTPKKQAANHLFRTQLLIHLGFCSPLNNTPTTVGGGLGPKQFETSEGAMMARTLSRIAMKSSTSIRLNRGKCRSLEAAFWGLFPPFFPPIFLFLFSPLVFSCFPYFVFLFFMFSFFPLPFHVFPFGAASWRCVSAFRGIFGIGKILVFSPPNSKAKDLRCGAPGNRES